MRASSLLCVLFAALLFADVKSPEKRPITNPKSLNSRANPNAAPIAIDELFYTRNVAGPSWSPDGREIVFTTNLTGRLNLWKVAADGGWPVQLSQSDDRETGAAWSPDGKWIAYQQDFSGGEYYDLFAIPASGGEAINLTNTKEVSETQALWSPDSKSVAFARKLKTSAGSNVALMDWTTRTVRELTHEAAPNYTWQTVAWTRDARSILAQRSNVAGTDSSVYRIETATGTAEELTPHTGQILYTATSLSPDGTQALIASNEKHGVGNVALLDIASHKLTWVTDIQWDAEPGQFSPQGDRFTYLVNERFMWRT